VAQTRERDPDPSITDRIVQPRSPFNLSVICAGQTLSSPTIPKPLIW
jgi:hypothetical protein